MSDETRPQFHQLRAKFESPLDILVILAALATIPIVLAQVEGNESLWVILSDWVVWLIFLVEYVFMVSIVKHRWAYTRRNWVKIVIIVFSFPVLPDLLAMIRVVRVARVLRVARLVRVLAVTVRGFRAVRASLAGQSLMYVGALTTLLTVAGAALLFALEPQTVGRDFWGSIWWAIVTVTTVGYGDIAPVTPGGRLVAVVLMLCGLGLLSTLAASISAYFIGSEGEREFQEVAARLDRIERLLEQVLAERRQSGSPGALK